MGGTYTWSQKLARISDRNREAMMISDMPIDTAEEYLEDAPSEDSSMRGEHPY